MPWSRRFDCRSLEMDLGPFTLQLGKHLSGQPLRLMAMVGEEYVWNLEMWHSALLRPQGTAEPS